MLDLETMSLDAIGLRFGTDKSSEHHNYLGFYEKFIEGLRNEEIKVLEIGVFNGQSLRMWEAYFPKAIIVGVDINPSARFFERGRIKIEIADQSNLQELTMIASKYGPFNIIVEDGSHVCEHQITTLKTLFPYVTLNGIYIVEDLQTNYGKLLEHFRGSSSITCVEFLKNWSDLLIADDQVDIDTVEDAFLRTYGRMSQFIAFHRRACLITKKYRYKARPEFQRGPLLIDIAPRQNIGLSCHVGKIGDVYNSEGCLNNDEMGLGIQGFIIHCVVEDIEYKALLNDNTWTEWKLSGKYAGTKGKSLNIKGVAIRVTASDRENHTTRYAIRSQKGNIYSASNGEECVIQDGSECCGLQVHLAS